MHPFCATPSLHPVGSPISKREPDDKSISSNILSTPFTLGIARISFSSVILFLLLFLDIFTVYPILLKRFSYHSKSNFFLLTPLYHAIIFHRIPLFQGGTYHEKTLQDLTIKDIFMFGAVMTDPENCKGLLELLLHKKLDRIIVSTEKV